MWWVPYTLRKRDVIVGAVKARTLKKDVKFGVRVPRSLAEAIKLDTENGNHLWRESYEKEMSNVGIAFRILGDG